jgi:hypothetical protein
VYTDSRTDKVRQIQANPSVSANFYHPRIKLQVRLHARASLVPEDTALFEQHRQVVQQAPSIQDYTTVQPPGTASNDPVAHGETIYYALIQLEPYFMDILQLSRTGHQRIQASRQLTGQATGQAGDWQLKAVVP